MQSTFFRCLRYVRKPFKCIILFSTILPVFTPIEYGKIAELTRLLSIDWWTLSAFILCGQLDCYRISARGHYLRETWTPLNFNVAKRQQKRTNDCFGQKLSYKRLLTKKSAIGKSLPTLLNVFFVGRSTPNWAMMTSMLTFRRGVRERFVPGNVGDRTDARARTRVNWECLRGLVRLPSTVAVSFGETCTGPSAGSNHRSTQPTIPVRSDMRKKSSHSRFSCYVKSHQTTKDGSKKGNQKRVMPSSELRSQNNNHHCDDDHRVSIASPKKILKLTQHCRANLCNSCSKLIQTNVTQLSSTLLCRTCLDLIRSSNQLISIKPVGWSKADEKELRHIIEGVVEKFQDHFGHAFEQLTKKYRLTFLERFVQLMNKCQTNRQ